MKRTILAGAGAGLLALGAVAPAGAHEGHTSCAEWAQAGAALAKGGALGQLVLSVARSGPGAVADLVAAEQADACEQREP